MDLATLLDVLTRDSKSILATPGAKAELSVMGPVDQFLAGTLVALTTAPVTVVQQANADSVGIPDFRIQLGNELLGWVELKAVIGKDLNSLAGHDKAQQERFVAGLHNLILTTGWDWVLYQGGRRVKRVRLDPDLFAGDLLVTPQPNEIAALQDLLQMFATYRSADYTSAEDAVAALASRAKALRMALVSLGSSRAGNHLNQLRKDFAGLLYRNGQPFTWERFVDSYVQIAAFGALLWRLETKKEIGLNQQVGLKTGLHPLLAQCLGILWSPQSQLPTLAPLLEELCRTVNLIPPALFTKPPRRSGRRKYLADPIVHAYEPFFRKYDQAAGEANGVYYTPVEIVQHIVSGVDDLLRYSLNTPDGVLDERARFLDPATGTGTFLLGLANEIAYEAGKLGLPTDQVVKEVLTERTSAFELFPGPYTIAHQRLEALLDSLGTPATERLPIYLADTLASPESGELPLSGFGVVGQEIVEERLRADFVKTGEEILVILGNPPYERVKADAPWDPFASALMQHVKDSTPLAQRQDLKSASDLFVAFWAWALWALQSPALRTSSSQKPHIDTRHNHGIVAFITNRTWLLGPSLVGLRSLVRKGAKEIWICDLGGDARGGSGAKDFAGGDVNVFSIQTGVAIAWLVFDRDFDGDPTVRYRRITGSRNTKLTALDMPFDRADYQPVISDDKLIPTNWPPAFQSAPTLEELFRSQPFTGIQSARDSSAYSPWGTEPEAVYAETTPTRGSSGKPTRYGTLGTWAQLPSEAARRAGWLTAQSRRGRKSPPDPSKLTPSKVRRALYRPFDERYVYNDPDWIDWWREDLQDVLSTTPGPVPLLISLPRGFGAGPLAIHTTLLPEQHAFNGRGAKAVFPLWLPSGGAPDDGIEVIYGRRCNLSASTMNWALTMFPGDPHDAAESAYNYLLAVLSAPSYSRSVWQTLESTWPRVPLSSNRAIAGGASALGASLRMIWELKLPPTGIVWGGNGSGPLGKATYSQGTITFANGRTLTGIQPAAWTLKISGWSVLPSWFAARTHWQATPSQAAHTQRVVHAATELVDMYPLLDHTYSLLIT